MTLAVEEPAAEVEPIRADAPRCAACGERVSRADLRMQAAVLPEPGEVVGWWLNLCAECATS